MTPPPKKLKPDTVKKVDQQTIAQMTENNNDKQMVLSELLAETERLKAQVAEMHKQHAAKLAKLAEMDKLKAQRAAERAEMDKQMAEERAKTERLDAQMAVISLASMFYDENSPSNNKATVLIGTDTSDTYPDHALASGKTEKFNVHYLKQSIPLLSKELKFDFCFNQEPSVFKVRFRNEAPYFDTKGDVRMCLDSVLHDAAKVCNCIVSKIAQDKIKLVTIAGSSLFSNVNDQIVVYDRISDTPVFAVATRTESNGDVSAASTKVFGQAFDQLQSMKLKGNPCPFGALSCHNGTYITWFNSETHKKIVTNHNRKKFDLELLQQIVERLPTKESESDVVSSQSPLKMSAEAADAPIGKNLELRDVRNKQTLSRGTSGTNKNSRTICISELFGPEKILDVFVNAIFCALVEFFPRTVIEFEGDCKVEINDAMALMKESYDLSTFNTIYRGPLTNTKWDECFEKKLHLVSFVGRGETSKVYRAISGDGFDCVIKIFVENRNCDNTIMEKDEFLEFSKNLADTEFANYKAIYGGQTLMNYVWRETLNNLHCIIMPFFNPIMKENRKTEMVKDAIKSRLKQFVGAKKQFQPCGQSWRHVGYFQEELYLFDLGFLDDLDEQDSQYIEEHLNCLEAKGR